MSSLYYSYNSNKVDSSINDDGIELMLEIPGVKKEDISVKIKDDVLTIKAFKKNGKEYNYSNSYKLSNKVDVTKLVACLSLGILTIKIPYKEDLSEIDIIINQY